MTTNYQKLAKNIVLLDGLIYNTFNGDLEVGANIKLKGDFYCDRTNIISLINGPYEVSGDYDCSHTNICSLEGAPKYVEGNFWCYNTNITSLEGAPVKIGNSFNCSFTTISSLEGAPKEIGGDFYCFDTNISLDKIKAYKEFLKHPTSEHIDETGHYKP